MAIAFAFNFPPTQKGSERRFSSVSDRPAIMCKSPRVSSVSPTSASTADVPASKEATAPSADDPSAKAPVKTSKQLSRTQLGRMVCRVVLPLALVAAFILTSAALARMTKSDHGCTVPPLVTASGVRQELVENGVTLYGISSCGSTQKQLVDLGTTEHYTQGLDYVDCEEDAAFCRLMNVTLYPTWQINGQLYPEYYSLEKLLVRLSGDDEDDNDNDDNDDDNDDPSLLTTDVIMGISGTLLMLGWFLVWVVIAVAAIACLRSPEDRAAEREQKEKEIENLVELNKLLPESARISILRNY